MLAGQHLVSCRQVIDILHSARFRQILRNIIYLFTRGTALDLNSEKTSTYPAAAARRTGRTCRLHWVLGWVLVNAKASGPQEGS